MEAIVKYVEPGSAADEGGIEPGDVLLTVNGHKLKDIFDYRFYTAEETVLLVLRGSDGEEYDLEIEKEEYEDIGLEFENSLLDDDRGCCNNCIFCFIDQLPPGMRPTMYFKDDDTRLSFLTGNYVTLTNIGWAELRRLVKYKMSPINVSVHATEPELRCMMLRHKKAGDILEKMRFLLDGGLTLNGQIVLVPEVNDGEHLKRTLEDLAALGENLVSVSVVPVGITKYREGLFKTRTFTREEARKVIETIESLPRKNFAYAADEFYITAGLDFPEAEAYDGFPQLENGVGMCSLLRQQVRDWLYLNADRLLRHIKKGGLPEAVPVHIATGAASYDIIKELAAEVGAEFPYADVRVHKIINHFFGETITVSGLLVGRDIADQMAGPAKEGGVLLLPCNMLRDGEDVFLDDYTVPQLSAELGLPIGIVEKDGSDFCKMIATLGGKISIKGFKEKSDE